MTAQWEVRRIGALYPDSAGRIFHRKGRQVTAPPHLLVCVESGLVCQSIHWIRIRAVRIYKCASGIRFAILQNWTVCRKFRNWKDGDSFQDLKEVAESYRKWTDLDRVSLGCNSWIVNCSLWENLKQTVLFAFIACTCVSGFALENIIQTVQLTNDGQKRKKG